MYISLYTSSSQYRTYHTIRIIVVTLLLGFTDSHDVTYLCKYDGILYISETIILIYLKRCTLLFQHRLKVLYVTLFGLYSFTYVKLR